MGQPLHVAWKMSTQETGSQTGPYRSKGRPLGGKRAPQTVRYAQDKQQLYKPYSASLLSTQTEASAVDAPFTYSQNGKAGNFWQKPAKELCQPIPTR